MSNPADAHIAKLIDNLVKLATKWNVTDSDREKYIEQIAKLRSSMEPTIIQKVKKD